MSARVTTTVEELRELLDSGQPPVLLDVRWALGDPHGRDHYAAGHIPGAVYVDLDTRAGRAAEPGGRPPSAAGPRGSAGVGTELGCRRRAAGRRVRRPGQHGRGPRLVAAALGRST